uniref:Alpha-1A adrenergic receptor-like n=1 Tax=Saccoglossus kowalevskii TaxID=10224 RepID=A0ABM0MAJ8_SACKO|nr:PREDICTED: alpha-1A adrenergic receptor-like [Saccoglossus kowalevskii]
MSLLNLTITAYDRFSALVTPLKYSTLVTVNTSVIVIILSWITITALGLSPLMGWYTECPICSFHMIQQNCILFLLGVIFLPNFLSICYFYYRIMSIARKQSRAISAIHLAVYPVLINKNLSLQFKGSKYAKTLAIIMGIFSFSWLPLIVTLVFDIFFSDVRWHEYLFHDYFALFIYCNSALNPWIYSFKNNDFKAALRRLKRKFCSTSNKESTSVVRSTSRASIALSRTNSLVGMVNLQLLYNTYKEEVVAEASVELEKSNENCEQGSSTVPKNKQTLTSPQASVCLSVGRDVTDMNCSDCAVQTEYNQVSEDEVSEIPL